MTVSKHWSRRLAGVAALVVLAVAAATVVALSRRSGGTAPPPPATAGAQHVDYTLKSSLLALAKSADLICECTVLAVSEAYSATPRVDGAGTSPLPLAPRTTVQDYQLRIDRAFRSVGEPPASVTVSQAGTRGDPATARDDPPLVVGSRYVLFLRRSRDGRFGFVSGPQGRLLIDAQNRLQPILVGDKATAILRNSTIEQLLNLLRASTP